LYCDRLYVASAGNDNSDQYQYPAAIDEVLGVSGLVADNLGANWFAYMDSAVGRNGSNFWNDSSITPLDPTDRIYPVSGIYGFSQNDNSEWLLVSTTTASPTNELIPTTHYTQFTGTSFAVPQVAALAALLRQAAPYRTYNEISDRIVQTRDTYIEDFIHNNFLYNGHPIELAGLVSYDAALSSWH
jgi:subtilisin family serine protease